MSISALVPASCDIVSWWSCAWIFCKTLRKGLHTYVKSPRPYGLCCKGPLANRGSVEVKDYNTNRTVFCFFFQGGGFRAAQTFSSTSLRPTAYRWREGGGGGHRRRRQHCPDRDPRRQGSGETSATVTVIILIYAPSANFTDLDSLRRRTRGPGVALWDIETNYGCYVSVSADELELTLCDCRRSGRCNRQLLAECNSGFEVRYRSVPTVRSGYTITH